jgi:hypothetical protein
MGCLILTSIFAGPRAGIVLWWLINPDRWDRAFDEILWPLLGFVFFPWTILMFVAVAPSGITTDSDYIWLAFAFALDLFSLVGGGGYGRQNSPI